MLNRLLQLRPAVHAVCRLEDSLRSHTLTDDDWILLDQLRSILSIFVKATETLSGSTYPTPSVQLPYYVVLASRLEKLIQDVHQATGNPNSCLVDALNQAWVKLNQYHIQTTSTQSIATILDPRYKLQTFQHLDWKEDWIAEAHKSFVTTYDRQYAPLQLDPNLRETLQHDTSDEDDDFMVSVYGTKSMNQPHDPHSEVERYLEEPTEGRKVCLFILLQSG